METQQQTKLFQAMEKPNFYPHSVSSIEQRETHISKVFLTGDYVYKVKKPVYLEFLDFTTLEKRKNYCRQEVVLNRRLTHNVYLEVVAIAFKDGKYYLTESDNPVEYAVKMRQLPDNRSMVQLLKRKKIDRKEINDLALILSNFYGQVPSPEYIHSSRAWKTIWANCEENFKQTKVFAGVILDKRIFQIIQSATLSFLRRRKKLFDNRSESGKIRDCHGDLRTGHIYFADDGIQIIDCIEFNDRFRYHDIASDIAFLAMDLDYEGFPQIASHFLNAYVKYSKDRDVFVLIDFYKCYRAFVRCKVNCMRLQEGGLTKQNKSKLLKETMKYLDFAYQYAAKFTRPTTWVVCGMPGSGKSTISKELSKVFGIKTFHSDVIRKELFGMKPGDPSDMPFEEGIYSKGASCLTYGKLLLLAQEEIERGNSVVLDATYGNEHHRDEVLRMASDKDANIIFIECVVKEKLLKERLSNRKNEFQVSDARLHHFEYFKKKYKPFNKVDDTIHMSVNTEKTLEKCMQQILGKSYIVALGS
jgi:aminoglycoside phosphotransferase family enzyme/predicted kinase